MRTYKYRLYPTKQQEAIFTEWLTTCRFLYNNALAERRDAWKNDQRSVTYIEQERQLTWDKEDNAYQLAVHSQVLRNVLKRLERAFQRFFKNFKDGKKAGYPRFKGNNRYKSFTYTQNTGFKLDFETKKVYLSKIGNVNIKLHRPIPSEGVIKTCTIKRDVDHWYACLTVELPDAEPKREIENAIGVDVGLTNLVALSNGEKIENPRWLKKTEKKLAKEQRSHSHKKKGSNNREKQRVKVARLHRKVRNQRKDFHHKLSRNLVTRYDLIVYEDFIITNLTKHPYLAKHIHDAGWGQLMYFTQYKAEEAGSWVEYVNAKGTTQECSACGNHVPKKLSTRIHRCPYCGLVLDRDENSSITILNRSSYVNSISGQELSVEPVRHAPIGDG